MELKTVALNSIHESLGAKMVEFAGFKMPVRYTSDKEEHLAVRNGVGIFDVSHMGEFIIEGAGALDLIQWVTSNDASMLAIGQAQYSCLPNNSGGIVDDLLVYRLEEGKYMLVVNASNIEKDWQWIVENNRFDAKMVDISDQTCLFAVQGPLAIDAIQSLTPVDLKAMKNYTFEVGEFAGIEEVIISATGYTGAGGFELYLKNESAPEIWQKILDAGRSFNIKPIGLGARDTLRLEMGFCLYGNDIDDHTSPYEAGLGWITKYSKNFINSDQLKSQKEAGINKKLIGFVMEERGIPRQGYVIKNNQSQAIGTVTSGSISPVTNQGIGLGYCNKQDATTGSEIFIEIRGKDLKAIIKKPPLI